MSIYRSTFIKQRMMEIYEQKLAKWPIPYESIYVDTEYGTTHLLVCGSNKAQPLFLIHGLGMTSSMWSPNIAALSRAFRCYAVDLIGDYGKSELHDIRKYPKVGKDYSTWLRELFSNLGIEKAHLLGFSHGGFAAINHAVYAPGQINKLILLAPSGLEITFRKVLPRIFFYLFFPSEKNRQTLANWLVGDNPNLKEDFYEQIYLGLKGRPKVPIPILVSGKTLRQIKLPILLLLGEKDVTTHAERAAFRMKKFIPSARIELIPRVGHGMNIEVPEKFNQIVLEFLRIE